VREALPAKLQGMKHSREAKAATDALASVLRGRQVSACGLSLRAGSSALPALALVWKFLPHRWAPAAKRGSRTCTKGSEG